MVPAAAGFGQTEVPPATIQGRSTGERGRQHIPALYYPWNSPRLH